VVTLLAAVVELLFAAALFLAGVLRRVLDVPVVPWVCGGAALKDVENAANNANTTIDFMVAPVILKVLNASGWNRALVTLKPQTEDSHG
jgi:hypothetical protein